MSSLTSTWIAPSSHDEAHPLSPLVSRCTLNLQAVAYIGGAVGFGVSCALLQSLSLTNCKRISDTSLQVLAKGCRRLRFVNLSGCEKVTLYN